MSRLRRLYTVLACRTGLRTGKSVEKRGSFPLTRTGTFGGFALLDYSVSGAARAASNPTPEHPEAPSFVGEATLPGNQPGLALVFTVTDAAGNAERTAATFPGVEPLRAVSGVSDEIAYGSKKLTRRVGVCREPTILPGLSETYGTSYPSVGLLVGDGTTVRTYSNLLSTHWKKLRTSDFTGGSGAGYAVKSGALYVNLPRALYRRYVKGCVGNTVVSTASPSLAPGEYRCDFFDGTSRVFTLPAGLYGGNGCRDVLAVSRTGATVRRRMLCHTFTGNETFIEESDYLESGETVFSIAKADLGADADGDSLCAGFARADSAEELVDEYYGENAFAEDGEYWVFHVPGVYELSEFQDFLAGAGTPVILVCPAAEEQTVTLVSHLADTATVAGVATAPDTGYNATFDGAADLTLAPAFAEFLDEEREKGTPVEIYYVLPSYDVTETPLDLPTLYAGEGSTILSVASAQAGTVNPTSGRFTALAET